MSAEIAAALQKVNRIVGRSEALGEAIAVISAMSDSGMGISDVMAWLEAEQNRNLLNLGAAGQEWADASAAAQ